MLPSATFIVFKGKNDLLLAARERSLRCNELYSLLSMSLIGPTRTTSAVQQVVGYLGYSGRGADAVSGQPLSVWVTRPTRVIVKVTGKNISRHLCGAQKKREVGMI